jgi:hypothetical protein
MARNNAVGGPVRGDMHDPSLASSTQKRGSDVVTGIVGGAEDVVRVLVRVMDCAVAELGASTVRELASVGIVRLLLGSGGPGGRQLPGCLTPWPSIVKEHMWHEAQ